MRSWHLWMLAVALPAVTLAATPAAQPPVPSDAECAALGMPANPLAFGPGERLEFALDALGAQAGKMTMTVLPVQSGQLPIEIRAETNTFFSKVRRVRGTAKSYLHPKTLRPSRYVEDAVENEIERFTDVRFGKDKKAVVDFRIAGRSGRKELRYAHESLDVAGAIYLFRQLAYREEMPLCVDIFGIRRIWRVWGKVEKREHVSLPIGEFDAWHLKAMAVRTDDHSLRREVHVWITDDPRRLPLAALGTLDIGVVRATLTSFSRPGDKRKQAQGKEELKW